MTILIIYWLDSSVRYLSGSTVKISLFIAVVSLSCYMAFIVYFSIIDDKVMYVEIDIMSAWRNYPIELCTVPVCKYSSFNEKKKQ